ncbi:PREDICTED: SHC SH2 domain-binding protein 1-like [Myotis brandtii]|uniref:SHC SH2 domain-binding protein 1-like n=1 Tax=Myotis brandtii TaxID=109478 RepID=UPI00070424C7|nr:PREDICTED: SHC SH2 domain-binding protein 1-like [Myotis brandtii]
MFQTSHLLFYERFSAYQDYILADCKASEVREFTAEFLEKVLEPSGWRAVWHTNVFEVLVEVNFMPLLRLPFLSR